MNTQFKFTTAEDSAKYVISIEEDFLKSKLRHFVFRTESQLEDFFRTAVKKDIVKKLKNNGLSLIIFNNKGNDLALVVNIFSNPAKETTTIISIKHIINKKTDKYNKIFNACPAENIADMTDYTIPTRIVVRNFVDLYCDTFMIHKKKINAYLSHFVYTNKEYFLEKYIISNVLQKIAGFFFLKNSDVQNLEKVLDKEPFWMWLKEETPEDEDNYYTNSDNDTFLCCLSLAKKKKDKKVFYELLLDQVYSNPSKERITDIKKYKEIIFEEPIPIQKRTTKFKTARKGRGRGLKIVKKGKF